jgi:hypothetical protein
MLVLFGTPKLTPIVGWTLAIAENLVLIAALTVIYRLIQHAK